MRTTEQVIQCLDKIKQLQSGVDSVQTLLELIGEAYASIIQSKVCEITGVRDGDPKGVWVMSPWAIREFGARQGWVLELMLFIALYSDRWCEQAFEFASREFEGDLDKDLDELERDDEGIEDGTQSRALRQWSGGVVYFLLARMFRDSKYYPSQLELDEIKARSKQDLDKFMHIAWRWIG